MTQTTFRPIHTIASEIAKDWIKPYFGAVPYIDAMKQLDKITDMYGADNAAYILSYFLSNANTWRGETARRIKTEIKQITAMYYARGAQYDG